MTLATLYADVEGPLRAWLRAHPDLADLTNNGQWVYFSAPDRSDVKPAQWLTLRRIGGGPTPGEVPMDDALITFGAYARSKGAAAILAARLVNILAAIQAPVTMGDIEALDAQVTLWAFQPDESIEPALPRVVVDAAILFRAA